MGIAKNPITVSRQFRIKSGMLESIGVLDATLAIDTKLFIDPLLLSKSRHKEISKSALADYKNHFERVISLLDKSKYVDDVAWKAARKLLLFPEIKGTCLGYGAGSIHGSGWGPKLTKQVIMLAREIVSIGIDDPNLFVALALFEDGIGADRISDMTTNVIFDSLAAFNKRALHELKLSGEEFIINGKKRIFLRNPYESAAVPVILVPSDILRELPIANDWDEVRTVANANAQLRDAVNQHLAEIWATKAKRRKNALKEQALSSKTAFETLLETLRKGVGAGYDVVADPEGLVKWASIASEAATKNPIHLSLHARNLKSCEDIVTEIVKQFKFVIEHRGLNNDLYHNKKPRREATAQRLFFAIAYSYCEANNLGISPELDTGTGKIDFRFNSGFKDSVLVEIKLSTNSSVVDGFQVQLEAYKSAEKTMRAIYVVIDVGGMGKKEQKLIELKNEAAKRKEPLSNLVFVDAAIKISPSKRKINAKP